MKTLILLIIFAFITIIKADETGYVNKMSVNQGDTLELHISTQVSPFNIQIYKKKKTPTVNYR